MSCLLLAVCSYSSLQDKEFKATEYQRSQSKSNSGSATATTASAQNGAGHRRNSHSTPAAQLSDTQVEPTANGTDGNDAAAVSHSDKASNWRKLRLLTRGQ